MNDVFAQIKRLWGEIGPSQRISLILAGLGIVVVVVGLLMWAGRPKLQLLYGGLDAKEMSEVVEAVESLGVNYEIRNGGNTIYVDSVEVHATRMSLASDGIPSGGGVGYEIFDGGSFGISNFVQRTNYIRAIQGELMRTINQLDGVNSSKVMIVKPENELLINGAAKKPTASVFVDTSSRKLQLEAVDSIRSLVSGAVEGLDINDVTVVDNKGNVLSASLKDEGIGGMTSSQLKYRKSLEDYYTDKVESMLGKVVGQEQVVVRVSVGLDMEARTQVQEQVDPDTQVVRMENITDSTTVNSETSNRSVVGEQSNVESDSGESQEDNITSNSQETQNSRDMTYEFNKTRIETIQNPGSINDITAAVFLALQFEDVGEGVLEPRPRTQEQLERIQLMVVNALGINFNDQEELNRKVTIEELEFQQNNYADMIAGGSGGISDYSNILDISKNFIALGISAVMLLLFFRMLKTGGQRKDQFEVLGPEPSKSVDIAKDVTPTISPELLNELVKQSPEKVSSALKNWAFPDS